MTLIECVEIARKKSRKRKAPNKSIISTIIPELQNVYPFVRIPLFLANSGGKKVVHFGVRVYAILIPDSIYFMC